MIKFGKPLSICLCLLAVWACVPKAAKEEDKEIENRVEALLAKMTLQEKIGQMNQMNYSGNVEEIVGLIKEGKIGSLLNLTDPELVNKLHEIALKESQIGRASCRERV